MGVVRLAFWGSAYLRGVGSSPTWGAIIKCNRVVGGIVVDKLSDGQIRVSGRGCRSSVCPWLVRSCQGHESANYIDF